MLGGTIVTDWAVGVSRGGRPAAALADACKDAALLCSRGEDCGCWWGIPPPDDDREGAPPPPPPPPLEPIREAMAEKSLPFGLPAEG